MRGHPGARFNDGVAIEEGQPAPAFTLVDEEGRDVSLADLRGRHVILYFYPRDHTPGCTKEACGFRDLAPRLKQHSAIVLGVSPDDAASHARFIADFKLPFKLLSDPTKEVMRRYGAWGEKVLYGLKRQGVIRSTVWIGPDGRVRKHWRRVARAAEHPAEVAAALEAQA